MREIHDPNIHGYVECPEWVFHQHTIEAIKEETALGVALNICQDCGCGEGSWW